MTLLNISVVFHIWAPIAELTVLTWSLMIVLPCRYSELK